MRGRKKLSPILLAVVAVAAVAAVLGLIFLRGRDAGSGSVTEAAHKAGQTIDLGGVELSVIRSYESRGTDSERPMLRNVFTIARVSLANKTGQPVAVRPGDFVLLVDGRETPMKTLSYVFDSLTETNLPPGGAVEGAVSWETPAKVRTKQLVYTGPDGRKAVVDLLAQAGE